MHGSTPTPHLRSTREMLKLTLFAL